MSVAPDTAASGSGAACPPPGLPPHPGRRRGDRAGTLVVPAPARPSHCLLIDPDAARRLGVLKYLATYALDARGAGSPKVARGWMAREQFDAIILRGTLPDADGAAFLRCLRSTHAGPILLVAGLDETSKIVALETGVSDVVDEGCSRRELVARVRALLRLRPRPAAHAAAPVAERTSIRFHDLTLDLVYRRLSNERRDTALHLAEPEFRLLCCLLMSAGQVLGRATLATAVYAGQEPVDERTIDVAVSRLRRAMASVSGVKDVIVTVRGEGYRILTA